MSSLPESIFNIKKLDGTNLTFWKEMISNVLVLGAIHRTRRRMLKVQSDMSWCMPTLSLGGATYFVTFIDDYSWKIWVYHLRRKDDLQIMVGTMSQKPFKNFVILKVLKEI